MENVTYAVKVVGEPGAILWHGDDWDSAVAWARTRAQEENRRYTVHKLLEVANVGPSVSRFA